MKYLDDTIYCKEELRTDSCDNLQVKSWNDKEASCKKFLNIEDNLKYKKGWLKCQECVGD